MPMHEAPECPACHSSTLTMRVRDLRCDDGRSCHEWSCDGCGHGWYTWDRPAALEGARDVAGFVGGSEY